MVDFRIFVEHLGLDLDILDLGPTFLIVASFSPASSSTILRNFQGRCGTIVLNIVFVFFRSVWVRFQHPVIFHTRFETAGH